MANSKNKIKNDIKKHIVANGQGQYGWYVGIAEDASGRLFNDHNVEEQNGSWIYRESTSSKTAREIEKEMLEELNVKGGQGGGSEETTFVYAYQITVNTKE